MASCSLHNYLRGKSESQCIYTPQCSLDHEDPVTHNIYLGEWRQQPEPQGQLPLHRQGSNQHSNTAKVIRDHFCEFFVSPDGEVPWQYHMI